MRETRVRQSLLCLTALSLVSYGCGGIMLMTGKSDAPDIHLVASRVTSLTQHGATAVFIFSVRNPNTFALDAHKVRYRLKIDGAVVAEGSSAPNVTLPASSTVEIELPASIRMDKLLTAATDALLLGEVPYEIEATFEVGALLFQRQIDIVESGVLLLSLPLGLATRAQPLSHL